ncbi:MAG: ATP-dependent DNA helicase RecQ [Bacteroidota bacterium]
MSPTDLLQKYWGYPNFRPGQAEIVEAVLAGKDTLALLPTGGGKSLCFQIPALAKEGVTLVVSPLIALMKDQVRQLKDRGIVAEAVYSGMRRNDIDRIFDNAVYGNTKLLYLSPERLLTDLARARIAKMNLALIAVDEAHCISQWGYDFRPPYQRIAELRELHPEVPVIAVTATATPEVVQDIQESLAFTKERFVYQQSFGRENLAYVVRRPEAKEQKILEVLKTVPGTSIVYVRSRGMTKKLALMLQRRGIAAASYHAGLEPKEKDRRQEAWIDGRLRVMVATNAFGMGIDKADVRSVIHFGPPDSPEAYFQEAGRGGRDGKMAFGIMLYHPSDGKRLRQHHALAYPEISAIRRVYRALGSYLQLAVGGGKGETYDFDLAEFSQRFGFDVRAALAGLKALERNGYILLTESVHQPARLQFIATKEQLYDYQIKNRGTTEKLIKSILRTSHGAFLTPVNLSEGSLANFLKITIEDLQRLLRKLAGEGIIQYFPTKDSPQLVFVEERIDPDNLRIDTKLYHFLRDRAHHRIATMITYCESTSGCRSQTLLRYFGEKNAPACGICDLCRQKIAAGQPVLSAKKVYADLRAQLDDGSPLLVSEAALRYGKVREKATEKVIQHLLHEGLLVRDGRHLRRP